MFHTDDGDPVLTEGAQLITPLCKMHYFVYACISVSIAQCNWLDAYNPNNLKPSIADACPVTIVS